MTKLEARKVADELVKAFMASGGVANMRNPAKNSDVVDRSAENEKKAVKAFKRAGFGEVPREDRKPYKTWLAEGLRVKSGEKSVKVGNLRLFHRSQCEAIEG